MPEDHELLRAWAHGDAAAGNEVVRRHFSSIYRFFRTKLAEQADELTQRTFLACVEQRERLLGTHSFGAYLYGIARKQLLRHLEGRGAAREVFDPARLSVHDLGTSPSRAAGRREEHDILLEALQRIPLDSQIAIELFYWADLDVAEIASVLEIAPGTVKSRLFRARAMVRSELEAMAGGEASTDIEGLARRLAKALESNADGAET